MDAGGIKELNKEVKLSLGAIAAIVAMTFIMTSIWWRFQQVETELVVLSERSDKRHERSLQDHQQIISTLEMEIEVLREEVSTLHEELQDLESTYYGEIWGTAAPD